MAITLAGTASAALSSDVLVSKETTVKTTTLKALENRNFVQVYPEYVTLTGHLPAAVLLGWLVYWFLPSADGKSKLKTVQGGKRWTHRTYGEVMADTGLTKMQAIKARTVLEDLGLCEARDSSFNGRRCLAWHMDLKVLNDKLIGLAHSSAPRPEMDADTAMDVELNGFKTITVYADVQPTVDSAYSVISAPSVYMQVPTSTKLITKNTEELEQHPNSTGSANASQKQVGEEISSGIIPDSFDDPAAEEARLKKNAALAAVRAKYGRPSPRMGRPKVPKGPNVPWKGIHTKVGPGSGGAMVGGIRVKKQESPMHRRPPSKFLSSLSAIMATSTEDAVSKIGAHSSAGLAAFAAKGTLTSGQTEMVWKKCIGNQYGFMGTSTLKERGQFGQLAKKLSAKEIVGLFSWLLASDLNKEGVTHWVSFVTTACTEAGAKGGPTKPHIGFLLSYYAAAYRCWVKATPQPVSHVVKTSAPTPAPTATPPPPAAVEAPDDTPESLKLQIGRAMLKGLKPPPDLTQKQIEEYKALALSKGTA